MPYNPNYVPKKRPRCSCICCGKQVEASEGLREHWAMKHRLKRKFFRDPIAVEDFEKITSSREAREQDQ